MSKKSAIAYALAVLFFCIGGIVYMALAGIPATADAKENVREENAPESEDDAAAQESLTEKKDPEDGPEDNPEENPEDTQDYTAIRSAHERIVVLDAGHGGDDKGFSALLDDKSGKRITEKEVTLDIAKRTARLLEQEGVYVVLTRQEDVALSTQERVDAANRIPADFYVGLHLESLPDSSIYGVSAVYDPDFYIRGYGCGQLADQLVKSAAEASGEKALELETDYRDEPELMELLTCGVILRLGRLSNHQECRLLDRSDHRDKLAEGIAEGILCAFRDKEAQ